MSRRRGLGRGLNALLGEEASSLRSLPVDRLQANTRQPRSRFDEDGLEELADSIRTQGVVQPIVVTPGENGGFTIVAGERRWRAARRAGLTEVPAVVRQVSGDRELLELALVENLQRTDLNPLEEADAFRMLRDDFQLSQEEIGARVGKSRSAVANALRLLKLPPEIQDLLRDGSLTAGQARPLLALEGRRQAALARRAVEEGLSAREVEAAVSEPPPPRRRPKAPERPDVHTAAAEEKLTHRLQTRVEIRRRRRGGGEVRIHFHSEEELMRVYDHLMRKG